MAPPAEPDWDNDDDLAGTSAEALTSTSVAPPVDAGPMPELSKAPMRPSPRQAPQGRPLSMSSFEEGGPRRSAYPPRPADERQSRPPGDRLPPSRDTGPVREIDFPRRADR